MEMIGMLVQLVFVIVVLGAAWYVCSLLPLPPPFMAIVQVIIIVIALIIVLSLLLSLTGGIALHPLLR